MRWRETRIKDGNQTISHHEGIAKPEASWDDAVFFTEAKDGPEGFEIRKATALVTSEFMQDAQDALAFVTDELDRQARP